MLHCPAASAHRSGLAFGTLACCAVALAWAFLPPCALAQAEGPLVAGPPTVLRHPQINDSIGNPVHGLTFLSAGELLATAATSGVLIWDTQSGKLQQTLELDERAVDSIALDPRGQALVAGGAAGGIKVWDARTFKLRHTLGPTPGAVRGLAISPAGNLLASASPNGQKGAADREFGIALWDLSTGERLKTIPHPPPAFGVTALAFLPGGRQIVSAQDRAFRILDVDAAEIVKVIDLPQLPRSLGCLALHPQGGRLASGVFEPKVRLWDAQAWKEVLAWDAHHEEAPPRMGVSSLAWSPDGAYLLSGGMDGMVSVWDAATGRRLLHLDARGESSGGRVTGVAITSDNRQLAASHFGGTATLWPLTAGIR